ncbi:MAG: hypothetical protein ACI4QX_02165 [Lachnospiraceae bacterium]
MNALEKVVDFIAASILLFLVPLLYYGGRNRVSQAILAGQAGETFLKRVATAGEITLPVWGELEEALLQYGCVKYEIFWIRTLYEPEGEKGEVIEKKYTADREVIRESIMECGVCRLQNGDTLRLTLYVNEIPAVYFTTVRTGEAYP